MRLKAWVIAASSAAFLLSAAAPSIAVAQQEAPPDNAAKTRMSVPTGGKMKMKRGKRARMHHSRRM